MRHSELCPWQTLLVNLGTFFTGTTATNQLGVNTYMSFPFPRKTSEFLNTMGWLP